MWLIEQAGKNLKPLDDNGPENMPLTVKENRAIGEQFSNINTRKRSTTSQYVCSYTNLTIMRISLHGKENLLLKVLKI